MSETNDSTFCEDGDHFKIVREGSRYEKLKKALEDADDYVDGCGCDSCEHTRHDIRAYERGAAELIEAANKRIAELETDQSDSFRYALELAVSLHKKHFCECVDWEPSDTLIGLLTQIDNMTTGWINKDSETSNEGRKQ